MNGGVNIVIGKITRIIKAISIYPNDLTMHDAVSKFGNDFFQKDTYRPHCIDEKQKQGVFEDKTTYPLSFSLSAFGNALGYSQIRQRG